QFAQDVQFPEMRVEFDAVEHYRSLGQQKNITRVQVAMAIYPESASGAPVKPVFVFCQKHSDLPAPLFECPGRFGAPNRCTYFLQTEQVIKVGAIVARLVLYFAAAQDDRPVKTDEHFG